MRSRHPTDPLRRGEALAPASSQVLVAMDVVCPRPKRGVLAPCPRRDAGKACGSACSAGLLWLVAINGRETNLPAF